MAGEISRAYHDELRAEERQRVALRIANGTKASSPQIVSYRRQHPDYTGAGGDAVGSFNRPFFANKDESQKQLSGGVLRNFEYARSILGQRAKDDLALQAELQGVPGEVARAEGEPPILSERESRELELNGLLSALQNEVESGNVGSIAFSDVRQIPRLLISLVPGSTPQELARLRRFVGDMINDVEVEEVRAQDEMDAPGAAAAAPDAIPPEENRDNIKRLNVFLRNIYTYIGLAEDDSGSDSKTRVARAKAVGKDLFDPKKVFVKEVSTITRPLGANPEFTFRIAESGPRLSYTSRDAKQKQLTKQMIVDDIRKRRDAGENLQRFAIALGIPAAEYQPLNLAQGYNRIFRQIKQTPVKDVRKLYLLL
jgi:hypothetical protein